MLSFVYFLKTEDNPAPLLFHPDYLLFGIESDKQNDLGATPKEISCSASHANATVSHMACAMKATEHLRKKSKKS